MKEYLKGTFNESVAELISSIRDGKISNSKVNVAIMKIDNEFPNEFINANIERKQKPWNYNTLKQFRDEISLSKRKKNNILHMAEIADEVYRPKRIKRNVAIFTTLIIVIAIIAVLLGIRK